MDLYKRDNETLEGISPLSDFNSQCVDDEINQIQQIVGSLQSTLVEQNLDGIFEILSHLKKKRSFIDDNILLLNNSPLEPLIFGCLSIDIEEIQLAALKILNIFTVSQKDDSNIDNIFSTEMMTLIASFVESKNIQIQMQTLKMIRTLSSRNPEISFFFLNPVLSSLSEENSNIVSSYLFYEIGYIKTLQDEDLLREVYQIVGEIIFNVGKQQAKFNSLKIIIKFLKDPELNSFFIQELTQKEFIEFYIQLIHSEKSIESIEIGFDILALIVPSGSDEQMQINQIVDFDLISKYIDYDYQIDPQTETHEYKQKYNVKMVKSVFKFLLSAFQNHLYLIPCLFEFVETDTSINDIITKFLFIVSHSSFEICSLAAELVCFIILNSSYEQISSISLDELIESMFSILYFDSDQFDTVYRCLNNIIDAFMNRGRSIDDLHEVFLVNEAQALFDTLIESDNSFEDPLKALCQKINLDFDQYNEN